MRYVCLIYTDEQRLAGLPQDVLDALFSESLAHTHALRERGLCHAAGALEPSQLATTVRLRNGRTTISDGPVAETKEQLTAFCLIRARDLNDAIRLAAAIPAARLGTIEVRPIREPGDRPIDVKPPGLTPAPDLWGS
jgi:hypothetical protein